MYYYKQLVEGIMSGKQNVYLQASYHNDEGSRHLKNELKLFLTIIKKAVGSFKYPGVISPCSGSGDFTVVTTTDHHRWTHTHQTGDRPAVGGNWILPISLFRCSGPKQIVIRQ